MRSTSLASPTRAKCGTRTRITSSSPRSTNRFRCISRASPRRSSCRSTPNAWRSSPWSPMVSVALEEASRLAVGAITRYVTQAIHCYYSEDAMDEERFPRALESAALRVHQDIQRNSPTEAAPIVTHMQQEWGNVGLLCSDGLTKHVPDSRIRERLLAMTSAKQVCEDLLRDALDAGGTDNITVLVGRTLRKDPS